MKMKKRKKENQYEGLSTTMMVDVLFILLIFFILISSIKKDHIKIQAAKVDKQAAQKKDNKKAVEYVLTVSKENKMYLDGEEISSAQLKQAFQKIRQENQKETVPAITLRTDATSSSGKLIEIFSALTVAGLSDNARIEVDAKE